MPDSERKIKERWEEAYRSSQFTELPWETNKPEKELVRLVKEGKIKKGRVLDVCCGSGTHSIYLAKNGFHVFGTDISSKAIKIAKRRAKKSKVKIGFFVSNAYNLEFRYKFFDFAFDRGCFHHMPAKFREKYVSNICSLLKNKGRYLLMCFSDSNPLPFKLFVNAFSLDGIRHYFSKFFRIIEARETAHSQPDGLEIALWSVFMEKIK